MERGRVVLTDFDFQGKETASLMAGLEVAHRFALTVRYLATDVKGVACSCRCLKGHHGCGALHQISSFREEAHHGFYGLLLFGLFLRLIGSLFAHLDRHKAVVPLHLSAVECIGPQIIDARTQVGRQRKVASIEVVGCYKAFSAQRAILLPPSSSTYTNRLSNKGTSVASSAT